MRQNKTLNLAALMAATLTATPATAQIDYQGISTPVTEILCGLWDGFKLLASSLAVLVFVAAGVQWVYNADDPGKRKAARDIMVHVIIGLIIVGISNEFAKTVSGVYVGC